MKLFKKSRRKAAPTVFESKFVGAALRRDPLNDEIF
jgi:hypothetical protein